MKNIVLVFFTILSFASIADKTRDKVTVIESDIVTPSDLPSITIEGDSITAADSPLGTAFSGQILQSIPGSAGDPLRGIQSFPGVAVGSDESVAPAIRGSRPGDNIYTVDFLPIGYLFHLGGAISVFNAQLVEKFSLYPSAYGPEFSGANGGVLDVKLRDPRTDRFHTTLDINILQAGALIEGPVTENQSFYFAGRFSYLDLLVKDQLEDEEEEGVEFKQFPKYTDYQGKYLWNMGEKGVVKLQLSGASDTSEIELSETNEDIENEPDLIGRHFSDTSFNSQGLLWENNSADDSHIKSALAHYDFSSEDIAGGAGNVDIDVDVVLFKSHYDKTLHQDHRLKTGLEISQAKLEYDVAFNDPGGTEFEPERPITGSQRLVTSNNATINEYHVFVQDSWFITDALSIYPGLVVFGEDYLDKSFVEPRLALEYMLEGDWLLSAGVGLYHQAPGIIETDKVFGNPQLDYIESRHAVVGFEKEFQQGWHLKSDVYYKTLDKLVTGHDGTRFSNDGEGKAYGLEVLIRKELTSAFSGWMSVTASRAERMHKITGERFKFDYDQPVNISLVGQYNLSDRTRLGAKYWYHSGSPYTPVIGADLVDTEPVRYEPRYAAINSERLPDFQRLDLRLDRDLRVRGRFKLSGYLELLNALNSKNVDGFDYSKDFTSKQAIHQLPRIISLGIKAEF